MTSIDSLVTPAEAKGVGEQVGMNFRRFSVEEYRLAMEKYLGGTPQSERQWLKVGVLAKQDLDKQSPDRQMETLHWYNGEQWKQYKNWCLEAVIFLFIMLILQFQKLV